MEVVYYQIQCDGVPSSSTIIDSLSDAQFTAQDLANVHQSTCRVTRVGDGTEVFTTGPDNVVQGTLSESPPPILQTQQVSEVQYGSPPSTYAILAALNGEPGAWMRVATSTAMRAGLIAPGLYVAGFRGWDLAKASVAGSLSITTMLFFYYGLLRKDLSKPPADVQAEVR